MERRRTIVGSTPTLPLGILPDVRACAHEDTELSPTFKVFEGEFDIAFEVIGASTEKGRVRPVPSYTSGQ